MVSRIRQNKTFITIQSNMSPEPRERKSKDMQRWRETGLLADFSQCPFLEASQAGRRHTLDP